METEHARRGKTMDVGRMCVYTPWSYLMHGAAAASCTAKLWVCWVIDIYGVIGASLSEPHINVKYSEREA